MKLRIKGNSIRYRLTRSEVDRLCSGSMLEEQTDFGNSRLRYVVQAAATGTDLTAGFNDNRITLFVPETLIRGWDKNETVGFRANMPLDHGDALLLILEKDFKCLDDAVTDDQSDQFENPLNACT